MAVIQVNEKWRISGDPHCWEVQRYRGERKSRTTGELEPSWEAVSFHQTLGGAAKALAQRRLRTADVEGVAALTEAWESIAGEIDAAFDRWRAA